MTEFPGRPDHPDFWLMAEVVQDLDAASQDVGFQRIAGDIDFESLMYVARQRVKRLSSRPEIRNGALPMEAAIGAAWVDAFIAGARFRKVKDKRGASADGSV